jgi:hypothetical protein
MGLSDTTKMTACKIAWETADAYSADIWGPVLWTAAAQMLLDMGFAEVAVAQILRSKMTRWARDHYIEQSTWLGELATMASRDRKEIEAGSLA